MIRQIQQDRVEHVEIDVVGVPAGIEVARFVFGVTKLPFNQTLRQPAAASNSIASAHPQVAPTAIRNVIANCVSTGR